MFDPVVRMIIVHWLLGMIAGALLAVGLVVFDVFSLHTLMYQAQAEIAGTILLTASFALTFGGVLSASAIMSAGTRGDEAGPTKPSAIHKNQGATHPEYGQQSLAGV